MSEITSDAVSSEAESTAVALRRAKANGANERIVRIAEEEFGQRETGQQQETVTSGRRRLPGSFKDSINTLPRKVDESGETTEKREECSQEKNVEVSCTVHLALTGKRIDKDGDEDSLVFLVVS